MKKILFSLLAVALVCLTSCQQEEDDWVAPTDAYSFKVEEADFATLAALFKADAEGYFQAANDYEVMQVVSQIPEGIRYEIYKPSGKVLATSEDTDSRESDGASSLSGSYSSYFTLLGTMYHLTAGFYASHPEVNPWDVCSEYGEPLTSVWISNNYWRLGDSRDIEKMSHRWYCNSGDLNYGCGLKSYYTRLFFGGRRHDDHREVTVWDKDYYESSGYKKNECPPDLAKTTLTGLRLVKGSNPPDSIIDADGIRWDKVGIYFDGSVDSSDPYLPSASWNGDLNRGAKGDYLYLFYTTDTRTNRKLMIVNPLFKSNQSTLVNNFETANLALGALGTLLTWTSSCWDVRADDLLNDMANQIEAGPAKNFAECFRPGESLRVDFIRLYDQKMKAVKDSHSDVNPANFNRNARGNDEIFISYNFITPDDEAWNKF